MSRFEAAKLEKEYKSDLVKNVLKPTYSILMMSKNDYLKYHWERTEEARRKVAINTVEWKLIWEKNFWIEYAAVLEKKLKKTRKRLREVLKEKLDEM